MLPQYQSDANAIIDGICIDLDKLARLMVQHGDVRRNTTSIIRSEVEEMYYSLFPRVRYWETYQAQYDGS